MLLHCFVGVFLFNGLSAEAPIASSYLPPAPPFQGYPPSRPHPPINQPPQLGDPASPEEDLESIVIEAPSFGRNTHQDTYGAPLLGQSGTRINIPFSVSAQQNSNFGSPSNHFPGSYRSPSDVQTYAYDGNQNNYAKTHQHAPNALHTSAAFNNLSPYPAGSRSIPNQRFNEYIQPNIKASYSHLDASINGYQPSSVSLPVRKDQLRYNADVNKNFAVNSHRNTFDVVARDSYTRQSINNQYLPPSRETSSVQDIVQGYSYERPSVPFNF